MSFYELGTALEEIGLDAPKKLIMILLADNCWANGVSHMNLERLMELTGIDERRELMRHIDWLSEHNYLILKNNYFFLYPTKKHEAPLDGEFLDMFGSIVESRKERFGIEE